MKEETICAISTPLGTGGVSIIRLSGDNSLNILKQIFTPLNKSENIIPRYMYFGNLKFSDFGDQTLCVYFQKPNSFTGEDVVEINLHGGYYLTKTVLDEILKMDGIRLAEPGEFSKRAVMNGKMDIAQAEGIIDIINATSHAELRASTNIMNGGLSQKVEEIQAQLTDLICEVDVAIDYPDQDIEYITADEIKAKLLPISSNLQTLLDTTATGLCVKNGVTISLVGIPNAGKSSLMNALLGYERAIVTDIAGTTRDTLNESYEFNGIRFNIVDTAGIHESNDIVESAGIERAKNAMKEADLILHIFDNTIDIDKQQIDLPKNIKVINILNKIDITNENNKNDFDILISAKNNKNIAELKQLIFDKTIDSNILNEQILITNVRHKKILEQALKTLKTTEQKIGIDTLDCIALLLRDAWLQIGGITGQNTDKTIIDTIFSKFCLGK